jgi:EthD domain
MSTQTHWRLAIMFNAAAADMDALEANLVKDTKAIANAASGNAIRIGVRIIDDEEPAGNAASHDTASWRTVDGAIEISIPNGQENSAPAICMAIRPIIEGLAEPGTIEVMAGAMFHMVPVRTGGTFLSLAFRRYPGTSVAQFRDWWHDQHAPIAIPVLTDEHLLAYDQVHVDETISRASADALGVAFCEYDAYDNLTFESASGFVAACSDAEGMALIAEDEVGRIDNETRRHALMREL